MRLHDVSRRDFLKYTGGGLATIVVGSGAAWMGSTAFATNGYKGLQWTITDALKNMVTHNSINTAQCYFWTYADKDLPVEVPGPIVMATEGTTIPVWLQNNLQQPHAFSIPGVVDSGPINPGGTASFSFVAPPAGTYMYLDNLNAPVNRMMGLHGVFISMPAAPAAGHKFTPYANPTAAVQQIFDDFGSAAHYPGLAWEQGDANSGTPGFRQYVWLIHEASSRLFAEVGSLKPGQTMDPAVFVQKFLSDPFQTNGLNHKPEFFTIVGQSGHFSHNNPFVCPMNRVGEPVVIRILNAGLNSHSLHIHANHVYVTSVNGVVQDNPLWVDTFTAHPLDRFEYTVPYMRPPDVPNAGGIGRPDTPLVSLANPAIPGSQPHPVWPPTEELNTFLPPVGTKTGNFDVSVRLSPICYPMHDHSEASQTSQGGNYNCGMISGINFTGDRNIDPAGVVTFPEAPTQHGPQFVPPVNDVAAAGPDTAIA
jgi:hypothetical protein